jgi:hypothetical protein
MGLRQKSAFQSSDLSPAIIALLKTIGVEDATYELRKQPSRSRWCAEPPELRRQPVLRPLCSATLLFEAYSLARNNMPLTFKQLTPLD